MSHKTIVDVRTPGEYRSGHVPGSINIPLQDIPKRWKEIKALKEAVVLCCASGNRSGQAAAFLKKQGVECENGGAWTEVNTMIMRENKVKS